MQQNLFRKIVSEKQFQWIALSKSGIFTTVWESGLIQRYYNRTGIFQRDYSITYKFAITPDWSCYFRLNVKRTLHRQDLDAKLNLANHNGAPVTDILECNIQNDIWK